MAQLRSSNPAFRQKFATEPVVAPPADATPEQLAQMYRSPSRLTIDDVVIHTLGLFALLGAPPLSDGGSPRQPRHRDRRRSGRARASFVIGFSRVIRPPLVVVFALLEGLAIGLISRFYEDAYHGIVLQALLGTGVIFIVMLGLYRSGRLRATPRMRKIVYSTHGCRGDRPHRPGGAPHHGQPLADHQLVLADRDYLQPGRLVVASLQFILDFDFIERAIAAGHPAAKPGAPPTGCLSASSGSTWSCCACCPSCATSAYPVSPACSSAGRKVLANHSQNAA